MLNFTKDPRQAMRETRLFVKNYMKGKVKGYIHLGEVPDNMTEAKRVIIALQDQLEKTQIRHHKATQHVAGLSQALNEINARSFMMHIRSVKEMDELHNKNVRLVAVTEDLAKAVEESSAVILEQSQEIDELKQKLFSAMHTVKIMSEGVDFTGDDDE